MYSTVIRHAFAEAVAHDASCSERLFYYHCVWNCFFFYQTKKIMTEIINFNQLKLIIFIHYARQIGANVSKLQKSRLLPAICVFSRIYSETSSRLCLTIVENMLSHEINPDWKKQKRSERLASLNIMGVN